MPVSLKRYMDHADVLRASIHIQEALRLLEDGDSAEMRSLKGLLEHVELRLSQMQPYDIALSISREAPL